MLRTKSRCFLNVLLATLALCSFSGEVFSEPTTLYRETYNFCTGTLGKDAASEANWVGVVSGLAPERISNLKVVPYGVQDVGNSVNSLPIGLSQGYTFWFKPVEGLAVFTGEFQFDVGVLRAGDTVVRYLQRLSGVNAQGAPNQTHLAFLVDDTWYISSEFAQQAQPGLWEGVTFTPGQLTYGMVPYVADRGPTMPTSFTSPLPASGTVRAFGMFLPSVNGRVRFDNFIIEGTPPSDGSIGTEIQEPNVALCPEGSPDREGGSDPEPPGDDDGDDTSDQGETDGNDGHGDETGFSFEFCPIAQQGRGRFVALGRAQRSRLLRSIGDASLADLRDRAIIRLYSRRRMRMGSLVNIKVGDYDAESKVLTLGIKPNAKPQQLRLGRLIAKALDEYLSFPGAPSEKQAPLFIKEGIQTAHTVSVEALCKRDIRKMLRQRAERVQMRIGDIAIR